MEFLYLARLSLPILILTGAGLSVLLLSAFTRGERKGIVLGFSLLSVAGAFCLSVVQWVEGHPFSYGMLVFDRLGLSFDLIFLISLGLTLLLVERSPPGGWGSLGELCALLFLATVGMMLIAHGGDLVLIFIGLEVTSLAAYVLAGMRRGAIRSYEASLKYFVLGSFAAGFLLYGITLIYGAARTTALSSLAEYVPSGDPILILAGVGLLLIGIGFKVAAVPFHFWSPDVYEGAPTAITAFMASAIKAAGFAALLRVVLSLGQIREIPWVPVLWGLAAVTMTLGNLVALRQSGLKRMLAYSAIAHSGYVLVGVTAMLAAPEISESALGAVVFYLVAYSLMTVGAFAVVRALGEPGEEGGEIADCSGLSQRHPYLAATLAIFLLALIGIPPTIGFMGKFTIFSAALEAGLYGLVILAVLNSALSAGYYLAPVVSMYFRRPRELPIQPLSLALTVGIFVCLFSVVYLGLFPSGIYLMARESVRELLF